MRLTLETDDVRAELIQNGFITFERIPSGHSEYLSQMVCNNNSRMILRKRAYTVLSGRLNTSLRRE